MTNYAEIDEARRLLGLGEVATPREVRQAYRRLSHQYHPDKNNGESGETMKRLNRAYRLLLDYIDGCEFSLREMAINDPYNEHLKQFYDGYFYGEG